MVIEFEATFSGDPARRFMRCGVNARFPYENSIPYEGVA